MAVVGIDLGTTNTVVAAVRDGRASALKDKLGRALLPSVVSFGLKGTPKVGYPAKDRRTLDPENTIFSIKRLIGRTYDSAPVSKAKERLPFELKEGPGKATLVSAHGQDYTLPEISALVLQEASRVAEQRLGTPVSDVVITVPANFNDLQRAATKVAGRTAGLEVLRIINEPTAAALAYGFGKRKRERIAVYDFGGGTFDVTLLDLSEQVFEVLATAGDTFLGGDDLDRAVMERMAAALLKEQKLDADSDPLVREQLRAAAERLKMELSTRSMAKAKVEELDFEFTMRRSEFESLTEPLLQRTLEVCQEAMEVAGLAPKELDQVLLVGGSTRIPLVRRRISSFFGKMPQSRINPDEVVAIGAAIQASTLEAKQGQASIPAAPRPRAAAGRQSSRAPSALGNAKLGTTQTGLAGLRKTLSGSGSESEVPRRPRRPSVLSALKSAPPSADKTPGVPEIRSPAPDRKLNTLAGVGERKKLGTLAGVGAPLERKKGTTNLGLGASPAGASAQRSNAPPGTSSDGATIHPDDFDEFEEVTTIVESPELLARQSERKQEVGRDKLSTLPGVAEPPSGGSQPAEEGKSSASSPGAATNRGESSVGLDFPRGSSSPPSDGSVTFDLEALEAGGPTEALPDFEDFDALDDETTQVLDPALAERRAVALDEAASEPHMPQEVSLDAIEEQSIELPSPAMPRSPGAFPSPLDETEAPVPSERSLDSAAPDLESREGEADLPTISKREARPPADMSEMVELGDSALLSMSALEEDDDSDLPAPARPRETQPGGRLVTDAASAPLERVHAADLPAQARRGNSKWDDAVDLPVPTSRRPAGDKTPADLPAPARRSAQTHRDLPSPTRRGHSPDADLPSLSERGGLPARRDPEFSEFLPSEVGLPLVGEAAEPARPAVDEEPGRASHSPGSNRIHDGGTVEERHSAATSGGLFDNVVDSAPRASIAELDELSVATALPEDDGSFDLPEARKDAFSDDAAFDLEMAAAPQQGAPRQEAESFEELSAAAPPEWTGRDGQTTSSSFPGALPGQESRDELAPRPGRAPAGPLLLDVTPLSLGVEVVGGYVDRLIERNSPVPCERTRTFATVADDQAQVRVRVSQGEEGRFEENTVLGEVQLSGLPPGPRGSVKIDVSFCLDESGMLQVSARDQSTGAAANAQLMLSGVAES